MKDVTTTRHRIYQVSFSSVVALVLLLLSDGAGANYNANLYGVVTDVLTYSDTGRILIKLDNQPSSHPVCSPIYFAIDETLPQERINRMLARALVALTSGAPANIGYDNAGNCAHGYIRAHRVG